MDQELAELQDELVQQKDNLLRDIRVIQKRKIKELDELYQIKLKKKDFEKELEETRESIKKLENDFETARKRAEKQNQHQHHQQQQNNEIQGRGQNEKLPSPITLTSSPHTPKPNQELIWVKTNLMAERTPPQPPRYQESVRARSVWNMESQLPRMADTAAAELQLMPQLQQRRPSGDSSKSFSPDPRLDPTSAHSEHLQRLTEDARKSFQPYKPHHELRRASEPQLGSGYQPHHMRPATKDPDAQLAQLTDPALTTHLLEYYRALGLLPPGQRAPPPSEPGPPVPIRPTPLTPGHRGGRVEAPPRYHDPRHHHTAYISGLEKLLIQVRETWTMVFVSYSISRKMFISSTQLVL